MNGHRLVCVAALTAVALAWSAAVPAFAADPADATGKVFKRGSQWMSVRAGYAKASGDVVADGMLGYGFGYRRFVLDGWSVGGFVHHELLGRFGAAAEIEVPLTIEVVRHGRWGSALFPYVGLGAGAFYHKRYRTGMDASDFTPGRYVTFGAHTPVRARGFLGLDLRLAMVERPEANPAFPGPDPGRLKVDDLLVLLKDPANQNTLVLYDEGGSKTRMLWSAKIDYSITY